MDAVKRYRRRRKMRLDARGYRKDDETEEEGKGRHGNTKIPFGLCQREGIDIQKGWTPTDAWNALEGKGYKAGETYQELKKTGTVAKRTKPAVKYSRPATQDKAIKNLVRKTAGLKKEQRFIVDKDGNIIGSAKGDKHSVGMTLGELRDKMPGNVAVHNHPDGGTFSPDDLKTFGLRAVESVVATKDGTYSLVNKMVGTKDQTKGWYDMREALEKEMESGDAFEEYRMPEYKLRNKVGGEIMNSGRYDRMRELPTELLRMHKEEGVDLSNPEGKAKELLEEYTQLEQKYKAEVARETRRRITKPFDDFYKQNAEKYGFEYTFTPIKKREKRVKEEGLEKVESETPKKSLRDMKIEAEDYRGKYNTACSRYYKADKDFKSAEKSYEIVQNPDFVKEYGISEENVRSVTEKYNKAKKELDEATREREEAEKKLGELEKQVGEIERYPKNYVRTPEVKAEVKRVEDVFRKQPVEYASCVDSSGRNLFKTTDKDEGGVNLTLYKEHMKNGVLTHNHPGGRTFSIEDISTAVGTGLAEVRACTEKGAFSLVRQYSLDEGPTESQKEFAWRYKLAMDDYATRVTDPIWQKSAQLQEDADRCNRMAEEFRRNWLKKNAHKFGWEYTEENING